MTPSITVILTVYKRNYLESQLKNITTQSHQPREIIVYQNEDHVDISPLKKDYDFKHVHSKDINFKFHGRFTLPLLLETDYTVIFDDDCLPGPEFLEKGIELSKELNAIIGGNGRNFNGGGTGACDGHSNDAPTQCDIVGHCWLFKTSWIHYMWRQPPPHFENGEDIHFCASASILGDIKSYVSPNPSNNRAIWPDSAADRGRDEHASWRTAPWEKWTAERRELYSYWITKGWKTLP